MTWMWAGKTRWRRLKGLSILFSCPVNGQRQERDFFLCMNQYWPTIWQIRVRSPELKIKVSRSALAVKITFRSVVITCSSCNIQLSEEWNIYVTEIRYNEICLDLDYHMRGKHCHSTAWGFSWVVWPPNLIQILINLNEYRSSSRSEFSRDNTHPPSAVYR